MECSKVVFAESEAPIVPLPLTTIICVTRSPARDAFEISSLLAATLFSSIEVPRMLTGVVSGGS